MPSLSIPWLHHPLDCVCDTHDFKVTKQPFQPLDRDFSFIDKVIYQGNQAACVPCSFEWLSRYLGKPISWETFAQQCETNGDGTYPRVALDTARQNGIFPNYFYLKNPNDPVAVFKALNLSPLFVGVRNLPTVSGPHAMVMVDVTEDGMWHCLSWGTEDHQENIYLSRDTALDFAVCFAELPKESKEAMRVGSWLNSMILAFHQWLMKINK